LGSLTLALADTGAQVLAIEKDIALVPVLDEVLREHGLDAAEAGAGAGAVQVVTADALELDWVEVLGGAASWVLVANLPYNVAVPIIMSVLEHAPAVQRMVVMVQKEVADRLVAEPGGRTVGVPSMRVAWYASAELLGTVAPEVFIPRPRVTSALVGLTRRPPPTERIGPGPVLALVGTAYRQRRKMLRSTLGGAVPAAAFESAGVAPTARPEELGIGDWARLAVAVRDEAVRGETVRDEHGA
jgi:16S rRNA (adenine1518-N6/adenine1519-N6)-dimethyltransferase